MFDEHANLLKRRRRPARQLLVANLHIAVPIHVSACSALPDHPFPIEPGNETSVTTVPWEGSDPTLFLKGHGHVAAVANHVNHADPRNLFQNLREIQDVFRSVVSPANNTLF